jgi:carbon storage regulator
LAENDSRSRCPVHEAGTTRLVSFQEEKGMLVLSRRVGEEIVIGGNVTVKIVSVQGGKVRLAITAPDNVTVDRAEIHQQRSQFNTLAPDEIVADTSLNCAGL